MNVVSKKNKYLKTECEGRSYVWKFVEKIRSTSNRSNKRLPSFEEEEEC